MFRRNKYVKTGLLCLIITIICISHSNSSSSYPDVPRNDIRTLIIRTSFTRIRNKEKNWTKEIRNEQSDHSRRLRTPGFIRYINVLEPKVLKEDEIKRISLNIHDLNQEQKIYNLETFGPLTTQTFLIVIQVHSRIQYLSFLIESLSRVKSIQQSLIIFSHDLYIPLMNEMIQKIKFARVMQIFYPFTTQLYPNKFPGQSPDDCPRNISQTKARQIKCRNAEHPDIHGHYREVQYTQTKHHWWWKINFVFESIRALQNYNGVVTFLEEDHYVTPDFLWIIQDMETLMSLNLCQGCNLFAVGTYRKTWNILSAYNRAIVANWVPSKHNMGMSFNRTVWEKLKSCAPTFCKYDDYNWDWSLLEVSYRCFNKSWTVLYPGTPRIFHLGECGLHHKKELCNPMTKVKSIENDMKKFQSLLFPESLSVETDEKKKKFRLKKGNGGWGDVRDHKLCLSF